MKKHQLGGAAAITEAVLYMIGFVVLFGFLSPMADAGMDQERRLEFVLSQLGMVQFWNILIYIVFGVVLVVLTTVVKEYLKHSDLLIVKLTPIFGYVWSGLLIASGMVSNIGLESVERLFATDREQAILFYQIIEAIGNGLGGGVEIVGGVWVLLISYGAKKEKLFYTWVNYLGMLVGVAGILSLIPGARVLEVLFGLGQMVWFVGIGIAMLRDKLKDSGEAQIRR
ncbi:MAG: hypothetical protein OIF50_13075 [Flavobacteriaceae bacterium]|nr:hypothetical protein [Flavobacteriaceae bacterium]